MLFGRRRKMRDASRSFSRWLVGRANDPYADIVCKCYRPSQPATIRGYYRYLTSDSMEGEVWMQRVNPNHPLFQCRCGWTVTPNQGTKDTKPAVLRFVSSANEHKPNAREGGRCPNLGQQRDPKYTMVVTSDVHPRSCRSGNAAESKTRSTLTGRKPLVRIRWLCCDYDYDDYSRAAAPLYDR